MTDEIEKAGREAAGAIHSIFGVRTAEYPESFLIVHKLFTGKGFPPGGVWADIGDGPVLTKGGAIDAITESFHKHGEEPCYATLRVWVFSWGEVSDTTTDALCAVAHRMAAREDTP